MAIGVIGVWDATFERSGSMSMSMSKSKPTEVEIGLSAKGLGNIARNVYENDFSFVLGDTEYRCPSFIASFLSPRICCLQRNDPTIREFHLNTPDPNHSFEKILNLCSGEHFAFSRNEQFVKQISRELWNAEVYERMSGISGEEMSIENVIDRLLFQNEVGGDWESEVHFCASHFYEIEPKDLCSVPIEVFSRIISDESIQLKDEDSFYSIIQSRICEDRTNVFLFEFVRLEYLTSGSIRSFIEMMTESFEGMTLGIWESVCRRLSFPISAQSPNDGSMERFNSISCPFASSSPMDGIISYLTRKHGCHVLDGNIISITASGIASPQLYPLRNVATVGNQTRFLTTNTANSWICYDFNDMRVNLTHYSIRTRCDTNGTHLRCWRLEGSNDGLSWIELDRHENDTRLNSQGAIATLSIPEGNRGQYRMIRIQQTGQNSSGNDYLMLTAIEFFGIFQSPTQ
jgi:hypothetical protein